MDFWLNETFTNHSNGSNGGETQTFRPNEPLSMNVSISLYSVIFLLSVTGNSLVVLRLARETRLRTVTNTFLLNLAISDLLLSVLCMPFSLVAIWMKNFIFGEAVCIVIRYFQAVSVGVSCYTLVAISLERYYAICQPLRSRRWQTLSHARRMIVGIWLIILLIMSPIAGFHRLLRIRNGAHACREIWPDILVQWKVDKAYSVFLVSVLLLVPLVLMIIFYAQIANTLWIVVAKNKPQDSIRDRRNSRDSNYQLRQSAVSCDSKYEMFECRTMVISAKRHSRDIRNRKRVIRMLSVIVLEYFICWTPLYTLNTWQSIDFQTVFRHISPTAKSFILLLAYTSSFIHPVTYCFMNHNDRQSFLNLFRCEMVDPGKHNKVVACCKNNL